MLSHSLFDARLADAALARHPDLRVGLTELEEYLLHITALLAAGYRSRALPYAVWDKLAEPAEAKRA